MGTDASWVGLALILGSISVAIFSEVFIDSFPFLNFLLTRSTTNECSGVGNFGSNFASRAWMLLRQLRDCWSVEDQPWRKIPPEENRCERFRSSFMRRAA